MRARAARFRVNINMILNATYLPDTMFAWLRKVISAVDVRCARSAHGIRTSIILCMSFSIETCVYT